MMKSSNACVDCTKVPQDVKKGRVHLQKGIQEEHRGGARERSKTWKFANINHQQTTGTAVKSVSSHHHKEESSKENMMETR